MCRLQLIHDWIERGRQANYNAVRLAALCTVSPSQLRRYFAEHFYRPPQEWLNELRLWDAMQLLSEGHPVKNVATTLHFSDPNHFSHVFKRYHGCAPSVCALMLQCQLAKASTSNPP